jgi:hypothetical protein
MEILEDRSKDGFAVRTEMGSEGRKAMEKNNTLIYYGSQSFS